MVGEVVPLCVLAALRSFYTLVFELDDINNFLQKTEHENLIRANGWLADSQQRAQDEPYTTTTRECIIRFRHPEDTRRLPDLLGDSGDIELCKIFFRPFPHTPLRPAA